jgi:hypothetical protein
LGISIKSIVSVAIALFFVRETAKGGLPPGSWRLSGNIDDVRMNSGAVVRTNTLTVLGRYHNGNFLIDSVPQDNEDNIAESAGWDGDLLRLIQRYPKTHGTMARTESLGKVEPTVYSRYATHAFVPMLLACADTNALEFVNSGTNIIILGNLRDFPEENDTFEVNYRSNGVDIKAVCHGGEEMNSMGVMVPVQGFENGFTRWTFASDLKMSDPNGGLLLVQYERFYPGNGKLHQQRKVTGKIQLTRDTESISTFTPTIEETNLLVNDYRYRAMLYPLSKGVVDQYSAYYLTNHSWECDTNRMYKHFQALRGYFAGPGSTNSRLKDEPRRDEGVTINPARRKTILGVLILFALVPGLIFFKPWMTARKESK